MSSQPCLSYNKYDKYQCVFDPCHMVDAFRWSRHIAKCRITHPDVKIEFCPYNSLHVIRLDRQSLEEHLRLCPDQRVIEQDLYHELPKIHGDLNFPTPQNLRSDSALLDEHFELQDFGPAFVASNLTGGKQYLKPQSLPNSSSNSTSNNRIVEKKINGSLFRHGRGKMRTDASSPPSQPIKSAPVLGDVFRVELARPSIGRGRGRGFVKNEISVVAPSSIYPCPEDQFDSDPLAFQIMVGRGKPVNMNDRN